MIFNGAMITKERRVARPVGPAEEDRGVGPCTRKLEYIVVYLLELGPRLFVG